MRKKLLLFATLLFSIGSYAQTEYSVSTSVEKKKALLEEYTGQGCYWCREGHAVASQMISKHGNKTYAVSIHTGGYAGSYYGIDLRTEEGDAIGNYFDCDKHGFPSGMVNRHDFIGDGTYIYSRSLWIDYAEQQINTDAPVNLYQKAVYDGNTNTLSIRVEGYFTAEQQAADQRLSVMITQDHIIAYQNGGGGDYEHNHVLRAMLTPAFGDVLESPAKGKFFAREYTYILPEKIGNVNVLPEDLTIISFVTNGQEEIQNVEGGKPEYVNYGLTPKAELLAPTFDIGTKWGYNFFDVKLRNKSAQILTSAKFEVTVNGETTEQIIECEVGQFDTEEVRVPAVIAYADKGKTPFSICLKELNGIPVEEARYNGTFQKPKVSDATINIQIMTDICAAQNHFYLRDADGNMIKEFGPYEDGKAATYQEQITVEDGKTYCIEVTDINGDGMSAGGKGGLIVKGSNGTLIDQFYNINGWGVRSFFIVDNSTGISQPYYKTETTNSTIYTLDGRRVNGSPQRGVYIENGKKIIIK